LETAHATFEAANTVHSSKTWVRVRDGQPRLADGTPLTLASDEQHHEFFRLRCRENQETNFVYPVYPVYPSITCTLSPSDLWPPETLT